MKTISIFITSLFVVVIFSCFKTNQELTNAGTIEIAAKGEFSMWKGTKHDAFRVTLSNKDPKQSVELYTVKSNDAEKWVNPSLLANSSLTVKIPTNGHLFIKNFNPNTFKISYIIK